MYSIRFIGSRARRRIPAIPPQTPQFYMLHVLRDFSHARRPSTNPPNSTCYMCYTTFLACPPSHRDPRLYMLHVLHDFLDCPPSHRDPRFYMLHVLHDFSRLPAVPRQSPNSTCYVCYATFSIARRPSAKPPFYMLHMLRDCSHAHRPPRNPPISTPA